MKTVRKKFSEQTSFGADQVRDGISFGKDEERVNIVSYTDIQMLDNLDCFDITWQLPGGAHDTQIREEGENCRSPCQAGYPVQPGSQKWTTDHQRLNETGDLRQRHPGVLLRFAAQAAATFFDSDPRHRAAPASDHCPLRRFKATDTGTERRQRNHLPVVTRAHHARPPTCRRR